MSPLIGTCLAKLVEGAQTRSSDSAGGEAFGWLRFWTGNEQLSGHSELISHKRRSNMRDSAVWRCRGVAVRKRTKVEERMRGTEGRKLAHESARDHGVLCVKRS